MQGWGAVCNAELINDDNPNDKKILEGKYQLYLLTTPI